MICNWISAGWPAPPNIRAYCTTRSGGISPEPWAELNLGTRCGDDPSNVLENRTRLRSELPDDPQWLHQVHGNTVLRHEGLTDTEPMADGLVAFEPRRVCAVLTADCLPVFLCSEAGDRVALSHAGWRGMATGVLEATVTSLKTPPGELMAWMGPAIGPRTYEVGREVFDAFGAECSRGFTMRGDRWLMDLYTVATLLLNRVGVQRVFGGGFCTFSEPERFFSYRRDGVTGRMASVAWFDASANEGKT